jgi:hypothetical protein
MLYCAFLASQMDFSISSAIIMFPKILCSVERAIKFAVLICCSQVQEKVNITWNTNHTVTYRQVRRWYFDQENSNGSLNDNVTMPNIVLVVSQDVFYTACYVIFIFPTPLLHRSSCFMKILFVYLPLQVEILV